MASYRKLKSGNWFAELCVLKVRDSKGGFPTKGHAKEWVEFRTTEIRASKGQVSINRTMYQALERYKEEVTPSKKGAKWETTRINKFIRDLPFVAKGLGDVDVTDISEWRDKRLVKVKPGSVNREMNVLSAVFTIAMTEWKWCKSNPVREARRPAQPNHRDRLTSPEEKQIMLDALGYVEGKKPKNIGQIVAYAYLIALETAMRAGEICSLDKSSMFLSKQFVRLYDSKNGDKRDVPLSSRAVELLKMFPDGLGIKASQIDSSWRKARSKTDIVNLTFHDSRHQAITDLAKKLDMLELAKMVGHRNPKNLMIYFNQTATETAKKL